MRQGLPLFSACAFVAPNPIKAPVTSPLHDELLVNTCLVESGGCCCTQRMVGLEPCNPGCLAHLLHHVVESVVPQRLDRKPAV